MDPYKSARIVLPLVLDHIDVPVIRAVDLGCGDMGWLRALHELRDGAELLGVDVEPYDCVPTANRSRSIHYLQEDLRTLDFPKKSSPWRRSDLVICVEVAEHLPKESGGRLLDLVDALAAPASIVLWSAALPGQGPYAPEGWEGGWNPSWHWNEQPETSWENQFASRGFEVRRDATEAIRAAIANDRHVDPWYKHLTLFARR